MIKQKETFFVKLNTYIGHKSLSWSHLLMQGPYPNENK